MPIKVRIIIRIALNPIPYSAVLAAITTRKAPSIVLKINRENEIASSL